MKFNGRHLSPSFSSCCHCSHTSGPMLVWYKSITNRQDKKWECEGKKRKRGIDVEERIGVTAKTIFLLQQTLQLRGTLSLPRDWEFLPKVLYQLVQDFFYETLYPLEQKRVCFACMLNTRWWEREEMVQKENNILIDETRTDLRQGFHRIHSSSSFLPRPSFYLQASMLALLRRQDYFKCLKRKPLLSPNLWS